MQRTIMRNRQKYASYLPLLAKTLTNTINICIMTTADKIRELIEEKGLTQRQFAELVDKISGGIKKM